MRLATLAIAATMLLAVGPSFAEHRPADTYTINSSESWSDYVNVTDDAYVKPGWWGSDGDAEDGLAINDGNHTSKQEIEWLWINDSSDDPETVPVTIDVQTTEGVVAAMDVFKVRPNGEFITPDCPQDFLEDVYPGQDESAFLWAGRLLHETTDYHQREGPGGSMSVDLFPDRAPSGFAVAIYPQAASTHDVDEANITFTVSIDGDDMQINNQQGWKAPDLPYHTDEWVLGPGVQPTVDCLDSVPLPDGLTDQSVLELPGDASAADQIGAFVDANLPEA